jgi:hypothetical protein
LMLAFAIPASVGEADRGVGVNLGRIDVEEELRPGGSYALPSLGVLNTGDEPSDYELAVVYVEGQTQNRPPEGWLDLQPQHFFLEPGEARSVDIRVELPSGADPGDYFAFIEARPVSESGKVRIGVAAATGLSFTVKPTSWFAAQRLRINRYLRDAEPWSYVAAVLLASGVVIYVAGRYLPVRWRLPFERRQ